MLLVLYQHDVAALLVEAGLVGFAARWSPPRSCVRTPPACMPPGTRLHTSTHAARLPPRPARRSRAPPLGRTPVRRASICRRHELGTGNSDTFSGLTHQVPEILTQDFLRISPSHELRKKLGSEKKTLLQRLTVRRDAQREHGGHEGSSVEGTQHVLEHAAQGRGKRCRLRSAYAAARIRDSRFYPHVSPPTARRAAAG